MIPATFLFPGEKIDFETLNSDYFDKENLFIPVMIHLQRSVDDVISKWYKKFYTIWFWLGLGMLFICLYRKPFFQWDPLVVIAATSIFLPTIMGMSMWRYVLSGIFVMQLFILAGIQSLMGFLPYYLTTMRSLKETKL